MKKDNANIFVTQPILPSLEDFNKYLQKIWDVKILTNNGPFHQEFEKALAEYLGVNYISLFTNGTLALITALHALDIKGEVITTPYSFVATTHALWWNKNIPVFVDIESEHMNIDPLNIEKAINSQTSAIMPVHVYGNPCNVDEIQTIANKYGLKVIYDAAHAFGVKKQNNSILNFGDLSVLSFHATKVFNTFEGGAIISHSPEMKHHIDNLKNFGFRSEILVEEPGINAKMNELQAALGLLQLKSIDQAILQRKVIANAYQKGLKDVNGIRTLTDMPDIGHNYAYFPIFINKESYGMDRDALYEKLKQHNIYGRKYFYPLISDFQPYKELNSATASNLPNANDLAKKVLCLPIYPDLNKADYDKIVKIIRH